MKISYEGIGYLAVTFPAGDCVTGDVCCLSTNGEAASCGNGESFCGVTEEVKEGMAAVQVEGFAKVYYSGTDFVPGYAKLTANGYGGVVANTSGKEYLVASVDTYEKTAIIKL